MTQASKPAALAAIAGVFPISEMHWETADPFLFCAHHVDHYPPGNGELGPAASLAGRELGSDFAGKDGWRMYHGTRVPGFPAHPHRGFETITLMRKGLVDHSDSLGATARFGEGDVQWMTAGRGIVHCEMFPLLRQDGENHAELFQIWLNLPSHHKMVAPQFTMLWSERIARLQLTDEAGRVSGIRVIAGAFGATAAPTPPTHSWAADPNHHVALWAIEMAPHATLELPTPEASGLNRTLYFFAGGGKAGGAIEVNGKAVEMHAGIRLGHGTVRITNGETAVELLYMQGRPIGEPLAKYGPFVMNTAEEIHQAMADYRRTQFGGWPWPSDDPVHPAGQGRFAKHADGTVEHK